MNINAQQSYYKGQGNAAAMPPTGILPASFNQQPPLQYQFIPQYSSAPALPQSGAYLSLSSSSNSSVTGSNTAAQSTDAAGQNFTGVMPITFYPQQQIVANPIVQSQVVAAPERKLLNIQTSEENKSASPEAYKPNTPGALENNEPIASENSELENEKKEKTASGSLSSTSQSPTNAVKKTSR